VDALSCQHQSFHQVRYKSAIDCMRNANKCPKIPFRNGVENEKVIRNQCADPDHHQKLITSRVSPLAHACQVWSISISAFVSYPVYRITERSHNLCLVGGGNKLKINCTVTPAIVNCKQSCSLPVWLATRWQSAKYLCWHLPTWAQQCFPWTRLSTDRSSPAHPASSQLLCTTTKLKYFGKCCTL